MDSTQDTGIILVQACGALRLVGTSFFSVFVCSITGAVACSYALECQMWDPDREAPTPPYIDRGDYSKPDWLTDVFPSLVTCNAQQNDSILSPRYDGAGYLRNALISKLVDSCGLHGPHPSSSSAQ